MIELIFGTWWVERWKRLWVEDSEKLVFHSFMKQSRNEPTDGLVGRAEKETYFIFHNTNTVKKM